MWDVCILARAALIEERSESPLGSFPRTRICWRMLVKLRFQDGSKSTQSFQDVSISEGRRGMSQMDFAGGLDRD